MNEQSMLMIADVMNVAFSASLVFALVCILLVLLARRARKRGRHAPPPRGEETGAPDA